MAKAGKRSADTLFQPAAFSSLAALHKGLTAAREFDGGRARYVDFMPTDFLAEVNVVDGYLPGDDRFVGLVTTSEPSDPQSAPTETYTQISGGQTGNFVVSLDATKLFVAGSDGILGVFNAASGALLNSITLGGSLSGIDISTDGTYLVVTNSNAVSATSSQLFRVDTNTLAVTNFSIGTGGGLHDVAMSFVYNQVLVVGGSSPDNTLYRVNLNNGSVTIVADHHGANITGSGDGSRAVIGEMGQSTLRYHVVGTDGHLYGSNGPVPNVLGPPSGVEAMSPNGGLVAIVAQSFGQPALHLYDNNFTYLSNLTELHSQLADVTAVTFNRDGSILYALSDANDRIYGIRMSDRTIADIIDLPAADYQPSIYGVELVMSSDESSFFVSSPTGVLRVDRLNVEAGTSGDDVFTGRIYRDEYTGGDGADTINGDRGNDRLDGGAGNDNINGGWGNDELIGGDGSDTLNGGDGNGDIAFFSGNFAEYEVISTVGVGYSVRGLGARAGEGTDTLARIEFAQFADRLVQLGIEGNNRPILGLPQMLDQSIPDARSYTYQIPGTAFIELDANDPLTFRAEQYNGISLPSWLTFNPSTRTFTGTPPVSAIGSTFLLRVFAADRGTEISDTFSLSIYMADGENVWGTSGDDILYGTFREETMIGLEGNDVFIGSDGADWLDGGAGFDTANYATAPSAITVNLSTYSGSAGWAAGDVFASINNVVGTSFDDNITGSLAEEMLWGGDGNDVIDGFGGGDRIFGEAGNDTIYGGQYQDRLIGGSGSDYINAGNGFDILFSDAESPNFLTASTRYDRASLVLDTGAVADQLFGGAHDDVLFIGYNDSADGGTEDTFGDALYVSLLGAASGVTVDFRQSTVTLGSGTVTGFEHVNFVEGSNFDDIITMRSVPQYHVWSTVHGLGGNDHIIAGSSTTAMYGDEGNDLIDTRLVHLVPVSAFGGAGDDTFLIDANAGAQIDGGTGNDRLVVRGENYYTSVASIEEIEFTGSNSSILLRSQGSLGGLAPNTVLSGNGVLSFSMFSPDTSRGELYLQQFVTAAGAAVTVNVLGGNGNDVIKGVLGSVNTINGGDGADSLRGGQRADTINGGNGNDKIEGGQGADILTGGAGADVFRYQSANASGAGAAADRITDFVTGQDKLGFALIDTDPVTPGDQGFSFIGTGAFSATGAAEIRYGNSGGDILVQADVNGDGIVDMEIILQGIAGQTLTGGNFVL